MSIKPDSNSSLSSWIDWLLSLHAQEIELGLDRVKLVAQRMQLLNHLPFTILVAGTNGKGSSVAMMSSIYQAAGYSVGVYTSPHLVSFNERIQINNRVATDQQIVDAFYQIETARGDVKLTYFEFSTLAALVVFRQMSLDIWILEVGLGGRLDAVNIIDADASLITAIDIDHSDWLGNNREVIAIEKAGITRPQQLSICSDSDIPASLIDFAHQNEVHLKSLGTDFSYSKTPPAWQFLAKNSDFETLENLPLPNLLGDFQLQNAAGVIALIQQVANMSKALPVDSEAIHRGLTQVAHPGRLQTIKVGMSQWLLDVAHNPQSASALADYLSSVHYQGNAIFSVLSDKDYAPMILKLKPFVCRWFIADLAIPRATSVEVLKETLLSLGVKSENIECCYSISDAVFKAQQEVSNVLCWGSFFTVSQVMDGLSKLGLDKEMVES